MSLTRLMPTDTARRVYALRPDLGLTLSHRIPSGSFEVESAGADFRITTVEHCFRAADYML